VTESWTADDSSHWCCRVAAMLAAAGPGMASAGLSGVTVRTTILFHVISKIALLCAFHHKFSIVLFFNTHTHTHTRTLHARTHTHARTHGHTHVHACTHTDTHYLGMPPDEDLLNLASIWLS